MRRLAVAPALLRGPGILLADQPTGDLDDENTEAVLDLLRRTADQGSGVLLATHQRETPAYAHKIYQMNDGVLIEETP